MISVQNLKIQSEFYTSLFQKNHLNGCFVSGADLLVAAVVSAMGPEEIFNILKAIAAL